MGAMGQAMANHLSHSYVALINKGGQTIRPNCPPRIDQVTLEPQFSRDSSHNNSYDTAAPSPRQALTAALTVRDHIYFLAPMAETLDFIQ